MATCVACVAKHNEQQAGNKPLRERKSIFCVASASSAGRKLQASPAIPFSCKCFRETQAAVCHLLTPVSVRFAKFMMEHSKGREAERRTAIEEDAPNSLVAHYKLQGAARRPATKWSKWSPIGRGQSFCYLNLLPSVDTFFSGSKLGRRARRRRQQPGVRQICENNQL